MLAECVVRHGSELSALLDTTGFALIFLDWWLQSSEEEIDQRFLKTGVDMRGRGRQGTRSHYILSIATGRRPTVPPIQRHLHRNLCH